MSQIVKMFFEIQHNVQLYHWQTKSFARHKASDELYETLQGLIDQFMESYMAKHGRPSITKKDSGLLISQFSDDAFVTYLENKVRPFLLNDVPGALNKTSDVDLLNLRDEMLAAVNKTVYLATLH